MAGHKSRKSSIDSASVASILTGSTPSPPAAIPAPRVGTSFERDSSVMPPPFRSEQQHKRTPSYTPRNPNRLSLSFPVAASRNSDDSARPTPTSSNAPSFPVTPAEIGPASSPADPSGFLVSLAGQERRVFELKEELAKAEADLKKLKKQWTVHEATKKRAEIRHVEPLQPLQTVSSDGSNSNEEGGTILRQSVELDRRRALLTSNIQKETRRKVISGGHTRTLSLLSPERSSFTQPFSAVRESSQEPKDQKMLPKSSTMPDTSQGITKISSNRARHSYQGAVTTGAKQIAEDVKAGLWTFLEDLRQATVGDEAVNGSTNRSNDTMRPEAHRRSSKSSLLIDKDERSGQSPKNLSPRTWDFLTGTSPALLDVAGTLWQDNEEPSTSGPPVSAVKQKPARTLSLTPAYSGALDDDWSNWDSPTPQSPTRWSGSTTVSEAATPSKTTADDRGHGQSSDVSPPSKREEIQWPALEKLKPGNLKRTVSNMMEEWERSLTPPPEENPDPISRTVL